MRAPFSILFILCFYLPLLSQESKTIYPAHDSLRINKTSIFGIHWVPLEAFLHHPRFRFGIHAGGIHQDYILDFYYGKNLFNKTNVFGPVQPYSIIGMRSEIRWSKKLERYSRRIITQPYLSAELLLDHTTQTYSNGGVFKDNGQRWRFASGVLERTRIALLFKRGSVFYTKSNLYLDVYTGIGVGLRTVAYSDLQGVSLATSPPTEAWFTSSDEPDTGESLHPYLALGIRIGYRRKQVWMTK